MWGDLRGVLQAFCFGICRALVRACVGVGEGGENRTNKPLLTPLTECLSEPLNAHRKKVKHARPRKRRSRKRA